MARSLPTATSVIDGAAFRGALPIGPLLVVGGYLALLETDAVIGDRALVLLALWPTLAALLVALAAPGRRRRWLSAALGCLVGTVVVVAVVAGAITLLASALSDPAPAR